MLNDESQLSEIKRLRERIKMLETDNASMHLKLSKTQKDVNQRLTEIEMQIGPDGCDDYEAQGDDDSVFKAKGGESTGGDSGGSGGGGNHRGGFGSLEDEEENNIESFI